LTNERNKVKADILTYNGLILGLCKEGKTKKAAILDEMFFEPVVRKAQLLYPKILKEIYNVSISYIIIRGICIYQSSLFATKIFPSYIVPCSKVVCYNLSSATIRIQLKQSCFQIL
jgi:hypothetical protein